MLQTHPVFNGFSLLFSLWASASVPSWSPQQGLQLRNYLQLRAPHQPTSANITEKNLIFWQTPHAVWLFSTPIAWGLWAVRENISVKEHDTNRVIINYTYGCFQAVQLLCHDYLTWCNAPTNTWVVSVEDYCLLMCCCFSH